MIQEHRVEITLLDVYFLTGLPMLGVIGDLVLVLHQGETLEELCDRHYYTTAYVCGSHILTCDIEDLSTHVVVTYCCVSLVPRGAIRYLKGSCRW